MTRQTTLPTACHPFPPVYDGNSRILILGSYPSVRSRAEGFFYGHPRNRFWATLGGVYGAPTPQTVDEKIAFLHSHRLALWDVCASCEIEGSSDASIRGAVPCDLAPILEKAQIVRVVTNGKTAEKLYRTLILPTTGVEPVGLPSTSPANASMTLPKLIEAWRPALTELS